ncbi:MAG TPA: A/G-specific adenine glycosylase [Candidatus Nitrosotenuis sp.]|jgi:A/G-specific adenine glycosylase|nr:A/G-specific adenine glycosylase [Candidatus Nitrosotenuis sp.]
MLCVEALLDWYRRHRRDLPWRGQRDPYALLVSEVMLQQTRVETVIPYYLRFLERFPDWQALAEASEHDLLAAWSGLGYYRRARNLQRTAREVRARGGLPEEPEELVRLPGVGPYTAAALASIAFGRPCLALDGNALRVWQRYLALDERPTAALRRRLESLLLPLLPPGRAGDFTQAVMELGAQVCTPSSPACPECPLAAGCQAFRQGRPQDYPPPRPRRTPVQLVRAAALVRREGRVLLQQNPRPDLLGGLWDCPWVELAPGQDAAGELARLLEPLGEPALQGYLGEVRHAITYRRIRCQVYAYALRPRGVAEGLEGWRWVAWSELPGWPLPGPTRRILALAGEAAPHERGHRGPPEALRTGHLRAGRARP